MEDFLKDFERFTDSWWPYIISLIISVISAIRFYVAGTRCDSPARIDGKNVIITGSSSGIGLETAKELAKRGGNLILAVRNGEKGLKALEQIREIKKDAKIQVKLLDVSEFTSIRNFVDQIKDEYDKIDILINNAGVISDESKRPLEGNDTIFLTNYLGPFLLTHLLMPLLKKSDNGRVINVSATAHFNGKLNLDDDTFGKNSSPHESFTESKLALTVFTKHMAQLHKNTKVTFNSMSPGLVRNTGHSEKYCSLGNSFITKLSVWPWIWLLLKNPKQGCQTIVYLAIEPRLHRVSGCYFSDCEIKEPADVVNDTNIAKALYEKSCKLVKFELDNQIIPKDEAGDAARISEEI